MNVVAHRHPVAASATNNQPLQESWSFSGWARAPFGTVTLGRLVQLAQVLLVLSPGNVATMCVTNQALPLIACQPLDVQVPASEVTNRRAAIAERAGVAWVVEHAQHVIVGERPPDQLTFGRTGPNPARKQQLLACEMPNGPAC